MGGISDEAIRERAYQIWQREGCPHGRDFDHWVQAQVELAAQSAGNGGAKVAAPRASTPPQKSASSSTGSKPPVGQVRGRRGKKSA